MNIVISPDSFKGSMASEQAAKVMARACQFIFPDEKHELKPMADGGEGTLDTLVFSTKGKRLHHRCTGPLGEPIKANYGVLGDGKTAVIEMAQVAGLPQVPEDLRNPDYTTSYGLGELIKHVLDEGYQSILIGLGGSATNDGGLGMLQALGATFINQAGAEVDRFGKNLSEVSQVDFSNVDQRLSSIQLLVASDVENPLCGEKGASHVFGPQKGATFDQIIQFDQALDMYSGLIEKETGHQLKNKAGAGAAGGLGFALMVVGAELVSGANLIAEAIDLEKTIATADLVLTGEGQSDEQTLYGKAPGFVAELAQKHQVKTVLISGSLSGDLEALHDHFAGCFSIANGPMSLENCIDSAEQLLFEQTKNVLHFMKTIKG
ncbi:glycerate kinase [Pseudalkalibacillus berkeleyi]|uniref:Glycerate kinase n=1 Tax=Pseudalkalibacillus berkeleyi TaxID=1069813 RepID=A0ABS9GYA8_9BACL|nr:glycerate kinase [Pseudalkalibacillus berkeleyi]MCF6136656.1 glycerate kinase [Pseudalkalibacillus berkeleyi]